MTRAIGYTTAAEVERLRAGKTAVVQGERSDACTVAVRLGEDDAVGAGVKVEPVTPDLQWGKRTPEGSWLACNNRDKLAEITAHFDGPIVPVTVEWDTNGDCKIEPALSTPTAAGAGPVGERFNHLSETLRSIETLPTIGDLYYAVKNDGEGTGWRYVTSGVVASDIHDAARVLSTPTAAGAGPVGEAVAFDWESRDDLHRVRAKAWRLWCDDQPSTGWSEENRDCYMIRAALLLARPVEEPGEVERFDFNAHGLKVDLARETHRAEAAEASLAETRERLEKERDAGFNHGYLMAVANIINLHRETVVAADVLLQIDLTIDDAEAFELAEYDMEALNRLRAEPRAADFFKSQRRIGDAQEAGR